MIEKILNLENNNILITGTGGMLGNDFMEILKNIKSNVISLNKEKLDVTEIEQVMDCAKYKPDIIIHCAAKVDADYCEEDKEYCKNVQLIGTKNIIKLAKSVDAMLFYPQSFLIFDGTEHIYEETRPNPLNYYGKMKYESEKAILSELNNSLIVRMAGFFGGYHLDKNFVGKFTKHLSSIFSNSISIQEVGDRVWQPTWTKDLAYNSLVLIANRKNGIYNMASHGSASFYDVAVHIVKCLNLEKHFIIKKVSSKKMVQMEKAIRPSHAYMHNKFLSLESIDFQRDWKDSLSEYLNNDYFKELFNENNF
ncbi:MAG: hypothetical protein CVV49_02730 [Spirochaetae bacterium HGW-Spirochaetae-5]|jgi:dTDP-4-dehydrorhamnose reductase|nr:MAG: hypothetical protein CVV49_02730 [Spirochaetae bacterium HGW-Spirochaetae-5]